MKASGIQASSGIAELNVRLSRQREAVDEEWPEEQPGAPREGQEREDHPAERARPDAGQCSAQLEADLEEAKAEQDTQRQTKATAAGSERTNPCVRQDQQAVPPRSSPHTG